MKLEELRDSIAQDWGQSNNFAVKKRIALGIIASRATIITRRYDQTKILPESLIETVRCIDLVKVEDSECSSCNGIISIRTKHKVPKPLIFKDNTNFNSVYSSNMSDTFSYVKPHLIQFIKDRHFSANEVFYTYMNNYIYVINANSLKDIGIRYVPENPIDLLNFGRCENSSCINDGQIYIEETFIDGIEALMREKRINIENEETSEVHVNE